jgi:hypothetical protein|tara:strand:+ start:1878 stop:2624 length:747 start_codon:yes stop_codon:yes gene_type:complete
MEQAKLDIHIKYVLLALTFPMLVLFAAIGLLFATPNAERPSVQGQASLPGSSGEGQGSQTIDLDWSAQSIGTTTFSNLDLGGNTSLVDSIYIYSSDPTNSRGQIETLTIDGVSCPTWDITDSDFNSGTISDNTSDGHTFGAVQTTTVNNVVLASSRGETGENAYSESSADWLRIKLDNAEVRSLTLTGLSGDLGCHLIGVDVGTLTFKNNVTGDGTGIDSASLRFDSSSRVGSSLSFTGNVEQSTKVR